MERPTTNRGRSSHRAPEDRRLVRRPTAIFVGTAYAISWAIALPLVVGAATEALHPLVAVGPAVAAVAVTGWSTGRPGLAALWRRLVDVDCVPGWRWWIVAASPIGFFLVAMVVSGFVGQGPGDVDWNSAFEEGWLLGLVGSALAFGVFEEVGWRGFLLPRLQVGRSASMASLLLWLIWAGWHIPMFAYHFEFGPFLLIGWLASLYFGTVFLTFLHNSTAGSLLAVIVFHVALDLASIAAGAVSDLATAVVGAAVVGATILAARWGGPRDLSRRGRFEIVDPAPQ